jgi:hypothetical protein
MDSAYTTGIFVAAALVVALVLLALVVHRRGRRAHATGPEAPGASLVTTSGDSPTDAVGPGPDDLVLVPFPNDTGQALVVGPEDALAIFDQSGLMKRDTGAGSGPVPQLVRDAMAAGGVNLTDRFQQGANSGRIVALTPETMKRLEEAGLSTTRPATSSRPSAARRDGSARCTSIRRARRLPPHRTWPRSP